MALRLKWSSCADEERRCRGLWGRKRMREGSGEREGKGKGARGRIGERG